ncbi:MAG: DUF1870 family protein [Candidimonas sp.]|nr:MAG: DUF1870 family protein [Candidimonas sp.]TAM26800.1 MAG: DUF1870 family protein [Candidimonas sp.]TAM79271.1 MAG: DUF1870 family protein [Candidimonas sp.]
MTSAELKTIRESLGLSLQWVADQAHVQLRTAQYWESGRNQVPADVAQMLTALDEQLWGVVAETLKQVQTLAEQSGALPEQIALIRYRNDADLWAFRPDFKPMPVGTHAALLSRVRRKLWEIGVPSVIEYMEPEIYKKWLAERQDNESLRAQWALEQS